MSKKKKSKKNNIFSTCFPCFSTTPIDCDELSCPTLYHKTDSLEYIVENLSIKKAPKRLVDAVKTPVKTRRKKEGKDELAKDFGGYVVKKVPPEVAIGPIVSFKEDPFEKFCSCDSCKPTKVAAPICSTNQVRYPPKRPGVARAYHAKTSHLLDDDTIKQILKPHDLMHKDNVPLEMKVSAHKPKAEEDLKTSGQVIPPDIMKTIEALKVAKPLHIGSEFSRNRKNLLKSSSFTSRDKETLCNFSDESCIEKKEDKPKKSPRIKRHYLSLDKIDASSSTSDFLDNVRCNDNISSDPQSSDKTEITDSLQGQSLKWKIIINKHKQSSISDND